MEFYFNIIDIFYYKYKIVIIAIFTIIETIILITKIYMLFLQIKKIKTENIVENIKDIWKKYIYILNSFHIIININHFINY